MTNYIGENTMNDNQTMNEIEACAFRLKKHLAEQESKPKIKIICQKCNKNRGCKKTSASFRDQYLEVRHIETEPRPYDMIREVVCDECGYVADSWYYDSKNNGLIGEIA